MKKLGDWGEAQANAFFREKNYKVLEENLRAPGGEVDLLLLHKTRGLVVVEVKTRSSRAYGSALQSITRKKIEGMFRVVEWYFAKKKQEIPDFEIDIITIEKAKNSERFQLEHLENVDVSHFF